MSAINQLRFATAAQIAENPVVVVPMRRGLVLDAYGEWQRTGPYEAQPAARIRLQDESSSVPKTAETAVGLDTALTKFAITDYAEPLTEGDEFSAHGARWVVGPVNKIRYEGSVYKTEAPLYRVTSVPVTIPSDFAAEAVDHQSILLTWSDAGSANTYGIEMQGESGAYTTIAIIPVGTFEYEDIGLNAETEYTYRIRAYDGFAYSEYADPVSATTPAEEVAP